MKRVIFLIMILALLGNTAGCGKKAPPVPPPETSMIL